MAELGLKSRKSSPAWYSIQISTAERLRSEIEIGEKRLGELDLRATSEVLFESAMQVGRIYKEV